MTKNYGFGTPSNDMGEAEQSVPRRSARRDREMHYSQDYEAAEVHDEQMREAQQMRSEVVDEQQSREFMMPDANAKLSGKETVGWILMGMTMGILGLLEVILLLPSGHPKRTKALIRVAIGIGIAFVLVLLFMLLFAGSLMAATTGGFEVHRVATY